MRAPRTGRHGQGDRLRHRPGRPGARLRRAGFERLHVVDLNGAFAGRAVNGDAVDAILAAIDIPVQLGGGIRDMRRSTPGSTRASPASSSAPSRSATPTWSGRRRGAIPAGSPSASTRAAARSRSAAGPRRPRWTSSTSPARFEDAGVAAIIYTDIDRDGVLAGPQHRGDAEARQCRLDPGHRLGRPRLDRRHRAPARTGLRDPRRRDRRPGAL